MPDAPTERLSLPAIITAARAGALTHAWSLFRAAGYDERQDDPAALAVKGRLLKDRALRATRTERQSLLTDSIAAYAAADRLSPQPYTQINVATLRLLGGDPSAAAADARTLLAALDGGRQFEETPYYLAATRAEALLLCGDAAGAEAAFAAAVGHSPDSWSDHASTLRQFALILSAQDRDMAWLDGYRPPQSLHYAGHLGVAEPGETALKAAIERLLKSERIGFGFGALAAGADIVIAETLLQCGAELNVLLPVAREPFVAQSVVPYGANWAARFEACYRQAQSVRIATGLEGPYEPLATAFAADLAMGSAVLNARSLESSAAQLIVTDERGGGTWTAHERERWAATERPQYVLSAPRDAHFHSSESTIEGRADRRLAVILHISFVGLDDLGDAAFADALDTVILPFRACAAGCASQPDLTLPIGNARIAAFATPSAAWAHAHALMSFPASKLPLRIAGHYGLAHWLDSPSALAGTIVAELASIAAAALPGCVTVSESFASALFVGSGPLPLAEPIGELPTTRLFAITSPLQ